MQTFTILDPRDRENPIGELSTTGTLMYHGTHLMFCRLIEQQGFCFDGFKAIYGAEISAIVAACDEIYFFPEGYACAKGFSDMKWVYFSASFRLARGYSLNVGGERIDGSLRAAKGFLAFALDMRRVELQAAHWEKILKQNGPHYKTERVLANLRNGDLLQKLVEQVEDANSVLNLATKQGYPVVYAVSSDQKWAYGAESIDAPECNEEPCGGIRLTAVSADRIVARIEYPNGISPDSE